MSTAKMIALLFLGLSALLFILMAIGIVEVQEDDINMMAAASASFVVGYMIHHFVP